MRSRFARTFLSFLAIVSFVTATLPAIAYAQKPKLIQEIKPNYGPALTAIETKLEARRKELGIPGISLAIVKEDEIIYLKGLGYKDFEKKIAVTPDTQFAIGSATKAFTALTVLMSQDEGKLSINDSPKKYLPYFKMYDPATDQQIEIRDLMSHSSGLNRTDLAMITGKLNRAELIQVAAQAKPTAKLREKWQYQNIMFTAAGEIASVVQKMPYDQLIETRIFRLLGMKNSTMSMKQMEKAKDYSYGYSYNFDTKETEKLPFRDIDEVAPAGSINSSARDMAEWVRFVLNGGMVKGKRLVSEKSFEQWTTRQMPIAGKTSYGFGWFLQDWNGHKIIQHGGNIDGFNSMVAMMPDQKLGFVLLTNVSASPLGGELMPLVWSNILGEKKTETTTKIETKTVAAASSGASKELIGKYTGPGGGTVEIKDVDGKPSFVIGGQQPYALTDKSKDTYFMSPLPETYWLRAKRDDAGKLVSVVVTQPEGEFEFKIAVPDTSVGITVDELSKKAIDAVGGEVAWRKITTRVIESDLDLESQGVRGRTVSYAKAPNKAATETTFTALGKTIGSGWDYFDGTRGEEHYSFAPAEKYAGKRLEDARRDADFYSLLDWKTGFKKAEVTGLGKVGDEECYIVSFEPEKGTKYREFYSTKTFLLLKHEGVEVSSTSEQSAPYTATFSDYRDIDGIKLPFKTVYSSVANGSIVSTITSVKQNVTVEDTIFVPRK